jgi:hypothetical protein
VGCLVAVLTVLIGIVCLIASCYHPSP